MYAPIDNIFGTHEGRLGPVLIFLGVAIFPVLAYIFILVFYIPWKIFIPFEILWTARFALKILCKESQKLEEYRVSKRNQYESSKDLINIAHCYDEGMLEYENGRISIIITGFTRTYFDDDVFAEEMKGFLEMLDTYMPDVYLHQVVFENNLQDTSERLRVYDDKVIMSQRMEIYMLNDEYVNNNSKLWRYTFSIKAYKHNWKTTMEALEAVVESDIAKRVFFHIEIANREEVSEIASRDICTYVSINDMLREKYANDDYDDSRVLYYGDEVPEEFKAKENDDNLRYRRVVFDDKEENE